MRLLQTCRKASACSTASRSSSSATVCYAGMYGLPMELKCTGIPLGRILAPPPPRSTKSHRTSDTSLRAACGGPIARRWYLVSELRTAGDLGLHQPMPDGGWVSTHEDITERRKAEAKIAHMARHDALTNLPNRPLSEQLEDGTAAVRARARCSRCCASTSIISRGQRYARPSDRRCAAAAVADRLRGCVREDRHGRTARRRRVRDRPDRGRPADERDQLAARRSSARRALRYRRPPVVVGASVGIAIAPDDGTDADQLLKNADMALYRAKERRARRLPVLRAGDGRQDAGAARARARSAQGARARRVRAATTSRSSISRPNEITGFEALLRWRHPERGLISPAISSRSPKRPA